MGGGSGLVQARDRHAVLGPTRHRTLRTSVGEPAVTTVNRPSPHVRIGGLDVDGALGLAGQDLLIGQVRGAMLKHLQVLVGEPVLARLPITELLGGVVRSQAEDLHGVMSLRGP